MNTTSTTDTRTEALSPFPRSWLRTGLLALPMALLTFLFLTGGRPPEGAREIAATVVTWGFVNVLFVLMVRTGKTDRYRATFFIAYALLFSVSFIGHLLETRGSMSLSDDEMLAGRTPFCHIVWTMTLIPAVLSKTIIFPGTMTKFYASVGSMFAVWIGASLTLGRGWCGWACFFGGWDDGFSRIFRKATFRNVKQAWSYLPYAVLLAVALASATWLTPVYCAWICPFKAVSEFKAVTSVVIAIQTVIFVTLFAGLALILPTLTRRRIQCSCLCPFGALQSFTNKISPFDVRVDPGRCKKCKLCITNCPTFSLDEKSLEGGGSKISCVKCGKCVDNCPRKAAYFHIKGTPLLRNVDAHRMLFLYVAVLFMATFAGSTVQNGIVRLINLLTTGWIA